MTDLNLIDKPFVPKLSFKLLFENFENIIEKGLSIEKQHVELILSSIEHRDELTEGIEASTDIDKYREDIINLSSALIPHSLSNNEIKAVFVPLSSRVLCASNRYKKIFDSETDLLEKEFGDHDVDTMYIMMCSYILANYYNIPFSYTSPPIYEVSDSRGIMKYYKSSYNADFISIKPVGTAPVISKEDAKEFKKHIDNVDFWKKIFPPNSWEVSGFGIKSFVDISLDEAVARINDKLLLFATQKNDAIRMEKDEMNDDISTLFNIPDVKTTFTKYDSKQKKFIRLADSDLSFALGDYTEQDKDILMCNKCQNQLFFNKQAFISNNTNELQDRNEHFSMYNSLKDQGFGSYMAVPLYNRDTLLGILEFGHVATEMFDKTHAIRVKQIENQCANVIKQYNNEWESNISSIIQHEFTSIHASVEWKFVEEAEKKAIANLEHIDYSFDTISFDELTALYGQMDIAGSSIARNEGIAADLKNQLSAIKHICESLNAKIEMPIIGNFIYEIDKYYNLLTSDMDAGREQEIIHFFKDNIHPFFDELQSRDPAISALIKEYNDRLYNQGDIFYEKRKDYDDTVKLINAHLSSGLDAAQKIAQKIYPHYFERYKTDGVEHNIFVGQSISPDIHFNKLYLENLRLWQLENICKLELEHHDRLDQLPVPLQIASLIMVYSNTLAIKYRMDEKQFDIDGAYNARYEIIKKRIDKAHIKGTDERITQPGKIIIIYTQASDLKEQQRYIQYLTSKGYLTDNVELFDIEDLQGVSGLKGIRVELNYNSTHVHELQSNINVNEILSNN